MWALFYKEQTKIQETQEACGSEVRHHTVGRAVLAGLVLTEVSVSPLRKDTQVVIFILISYDALSLLCSVFNNSAFSFYSQNLENGKVEGDFKDGEGWHH